MGAPQASAGAPSRSASGQRRKRPGKKGLITGFLKPTGGMPGTSPVAPPLPQPPLVAVELIAVDLSESLLASQSALGPYRSRGGSRKRDRQLVELSQEVDSSGKGRTELSEISGHTALQADDRGYDSCDSEDMNIRFRRYKERNLADWLGTRLPWEGWTYDATCAMTSTAHKIDLYSWLPGRRRWGDARRGPGRTQEDTVRRREQLVRAAQGRTVQPVITAEEVAAGRREGLSCAAVDAKLDAANIGADELEKGTTKRRRMGLMHAEASPGGIGAQVPEPVGGTATRGKRKRTHRTAADAKRRREAAATAFDATDSDEDGPCGPGPFFHPGGGKAG